MRILLIAPDYDRTVTGESWSTYKWVEGISTRCETVVLTHHRRGWKSSDSPIAATSVVNWEDPDLPGFSGRLAWELKPAYFVFYFKARRWLKQALRRGEHFDLIHQINPLALRYPCPARKLGVKYIMGPLAGSLATPPAFAEAARERHWFRKLRHLDGLRLRYDPWLRGSYSDAAAIIGVAPYVGELLAPSPIRRFEIMSETGVEQVNFRPKKAPPPGFPLRLLFVGRLIATKGILEAIEAVAIAVRKHAITFDVIGVGDASTQCEQLVARLGLDQIVTLHGRLPKEEVFKWYDRSDVFLFPSYREPSGNVVFESMSRGLPVITSTLGGPGYVVTDACGLRCPSHDRRAYICSLAQAIISLATQSDKIPAMSSAAIQRISDIAIWPSKIDSLIELYVDISKPTL